MPFIFQNWTFSLSFQNEPIELKVICFGFGFLFCLCVFLGDPRRPYPTDLEMRSGLLGQMNNPSTNGVNGHLPGDALAAGRLPGNPI